MIRFRPNYEIMSESLKAEQTFDSIEDMVRSLCDQLHRVIRFIGSDRTITPDLLIVDDVPMFNPETGCENEHMVLLKRMTSCLPPVCIGYCEE